MKIKNALLAAVMPATLFATSAQAAVFTFDLAGAYTAAWTIDTEAMTDNYVTSGEGFGFYDVAGTFGGTKTRAVSINFFSTVNDGGLSLELDDATSPFVGPQLYSGAERDLAFRIGTYALNGSTLTIASPVNGAVPEPATWLLAITGFGLVGVALRTRRRYRVAFFAG